MPDLTARLDALGAAASFLGVKARGEYVRKEITRIGRVLQDAGIKVR